MSRTGKRPIIIPAGTEVSVKDAEIIVKGKGGTLKRPLHPLVDVKVNGAEVFVEPKSTNRLAKALWGTYAAHIRNMISGVNTPFAKKLQIEGIGYKAELQGKNLKMVLGFSHPIIVAIPDGVTVNFRQRFAHTRSRNRIKVKVFVTKVSVFARRKVRRLQPLHKHYEND